MHYTSFISVFWALAAVFKLGMGGSLPLSPAFGDVDQLLDAPGVGQRLGVLHVLAGDLVEGAADGRHRLVGEQGGVSAGQSVHQVPHGVLS